ncbi:MAG: hypothetical protein J0H12_04795 [Candidatus Paracaedimonas acanthamoebae]|uniref:Uncharacterized protein n=1 Tax=Candidatus Paracaedimonas acanthamoebae TaxID=244581 RepID=A0A8J7PWF5_9PROT|nr:hypothetical protein [Candidatus Paracaedimonas acanthamoebae]
MEITSQGIADLIKACPDDLKPGKFVQNEEVLMSQDLDGIHQHMCHLLDRLVNKFSLN